MSKAVRFFVHRMDDIRDCYVVIESASEKKPKRARQLLHDCWLKEFEKKWRTIHAKSESVLLSWFTFHGLYGFQRLSFVLFGVVK